MARVWCTAVQLQAFIRVRVSISIKCQAASLTSALLSRYTSSQIEEATALVRHLVATQSNVRLIVFLLLRYNTSLGVLQSRTSLTKPTFRRWRSSPTENLGQMLKSLKTRRGRLVIMVPCILILLLLSKLAFMSKRHVIRQSLPEIDPTTEACYEYIRSSSTSSLNYVKHDHDFLSRHGCLVDHGEWFLKEGLVNVAGKF